MSRSTLLTTIDLPMSRHVSNTQDWLLLVTLSVIVSRPAISAAKQRDVFAAPQEAAHAKVPGRVTQADVSVDVQVLNAERTKDIFDLDLINKGVQPLFIKIHNASQQTYRFSKASVDAHHIPAALAARVAYDNLLLVGGRVVKYTVTSIPKAIFVKSHKNKKKDVKPALLNRETRAVFEKEEIADRNIKPKETLSGFLYLHLLAPHSHVTVTLINVQTQAPLVFDIPPHEP